MAKGSKGGGKSSSSSKGKTYRSAVTGHYVSEHYARTHPKTTVSETNK